MTYSIVNYVRAKMTYIREFIVRLKKPSDYQFFGIVMLIVALTLVHAILENRVTGTTTAAFMRERLRIPMLPYALLMASCGGYLLASARPRLEVYLLVSLPVLLYVASVLATSIVYQFPLTGAVIHLGMYVALLRDAGRTDEPAATR